jgi:hypothetical protein
MVAGIASFIEKFRDYGDCYTIIGGTACDILMTEADTEFRATKDIDMILILEARQRDFIKIFWEYVIEAGYKFGWKNSDTVHFYHGIVDRGLKLEFSNGFFRADPHTLLSIAF